MGKTGRWSRSVGLVRTKGGFDMGERGKNGEMKHRRTNLEAVEPESDKLRAMYDDVVNQGVPQHITDLVRRLSDQD
jgi:hypothetical protein